ncbi:MAG: hypothetical protein KAU41_10250, partial [Deltaproteobacteria bacterium]|nr:hypothetical protein [Deltaproteobacteria bacterium]
DFVKLMEGLSDVRNLVEKDGVVAFAELRADAGKIGLESVLKELTSLNNFVHLGFQRTFWLALAQN